MTDDELLRWAAEDVLARGVDQSYLPLLGWPGFGLAVAEISRRGWRWAINWSLDPTSTEGLFVVRWSPGFYALVVTDDNYAVAAWRALYQAMEATK